jgi:hypothetical protein
MKYVLCLTLLGVAAVGADRTFTGEIMDSQCAQMSSHDNMMKGEGANNAKECTLSCVKKGGSFAFFDPAAKRAYQLDSQKKARDYAGQKVTITGTLDSGGDTIHIAKIEPAQ